MKRNKFFLESTSRGRPSHARNAQSKVGKSHNLGRKKRRCPIKVEPWKEGDFS